MIIYNENALHIETSQMGVSHRYQKLQTGNT
jgi:hypothetical protein